MRGDFGICVWDPTDTHLWLMRDIIGTRTLYYDEIDDRLVFASRLEDLIATTKRPLEVRDDYVVSFVRRLSLIGVTPFSGVSAVGPAEAVCATRRGTRTRRLWAIDALRTVRYDDRGDYEAEFVRRFEHAIRRRLLSSAGSVTVELSGGLDSSSIACTAASLCCGEGRLEKQLYTLSNIYTSAESANESAFIGSVERWTKTPFIHLELDDQDIDDCTDHWQSSSPLIPEPRALFQGLMARAAVAMAQNGSDVLLSGAGGDNVMWSTVLYPPDLADALRAGQFASLHRSLVAWAKALQRSYLDLLINGSLWPILPRSLRWTRAIDTPPYFLRAELTKDSDVPDLGNDIASDYYRAPPGRRSRIRMVAHAIASIESGVDSAFPIGLSYPFLDRDFIEFCLAVPSEHIIRPDVNRSLQRRALRSILPPEILERTDKAPFSEVVARVLLRQRRRIMATMGQAPLQVVSRGYVRERILRQAIERCAVLSDAEVSELWMIWALEMWLRRVASRR